VLQHGRDPTAERTQLLAKLLFDTALLESGFQLEDNKAFNNRVYSLVKDVLKIKKDFNSVEDAEVCHHHRFGPARLSRSSCKRLI
jgi:hypothetical protein